jgi:hypothetical protein
LTNLTLWGYGLQSPLERGTALEIDYLRRSAKEARLQKISKPIIRSKMQEEKPISNRFQKRPTGMVWTLP